MGAGKTAVGRLLSEKLGYRYCDADKVAETKAGMTVSDVFARHGEAYFRDLETGILRDLSRKDRQVVATGGGAVMREENLKAMRAGGVTVYLKASPDVIWTRVKHSRTRPLLEVEDPRAAVTELLSKREPRYEMADLTVDTDGLTLDEVASEIVKRLGKPGA